MKKLIVTALLILMAIPALAGEIEDLAMQHRKLQALKQYHEERLEKIVVDMSILQQRYELARKQLMEKKDEKAPADKPDPAAGH